MAEESLALLKQLTEQNQFELEDAPIPGCPHGFPGGVSAPQVPDSGSTEPLPEIFRAKKSGGGEIRLLKTVLTTACERNCNYCAFRAGRDVRRGTLKPDEMARVFTGLYAGGIAEGMFLSSGI
ncbi:MAG: hypothetical protein ACYC7M_09685, partial [Bellilinea sp.]